MVVIGHLVILAHPYPPVTGTYTTVGLTEHRVLTVKFGNKALQKHLLTANTCTVFATKSYLAIDNTGQLS